MSDILIGVIVFGLVFGAAIFGMFLGRNLRVLEQKVNAISNQQSEIFVYHPLLRIAHHVQHPVQKQGRPVPNRRSGQADRLNELERTNGARGSGAT
jgi:hypothetical protein